MPEQRNGPPPTRRRRGLRGGIDLGGTKIEAVVVDGRHRLLGSCRRPTPTSGTPSDVAHEMAAAMTEATKMAGTEPSALSGVGVGSPGTVDTETGTVSSARNLPGWDDSFALGPELAGAFGTRVRVGNDVQVATDAEYRLGAGRPYRSVLGVFWGTGVGGGIVLDGESWRGLGGAGEIGHMVVRIGGRRCPCGNKGCMEAYAGRLAMEERARAEIGKGRKSDLVKIARRKHRDRFTSAVWGTAIEQGDTLAVELIDEAVGALGAGIASALNLLDIEAVVVGGGLGVRFGEEYVSKIAKAMGPHLFPGHQAPAVHLAGLGDIGGAVGAALLVRRKR
jgi:glucokinase